MVRTVEITRYVTPLREGSSLPALVEADDGREYVVKFRGAGHGPKALVAELVVGEIGRALGLAVPQIVVAALPESIARAETHDEIRDLLGWSIGLNIGLEFIPGALAPSLTEPPPEGAEWASDVAWFDALTVNPDRTPRNANLVVGAGRTWLIDHGAALYVHHAWGDPEAQARRAFDRIAEHVLLPHAGSLHEADVRLASRLDASLLAEIIDAIPDAWLDDPARERDRYRRYFATRLGVRDLWVPPAEEARLRAQRDAVA
jgi:hypothetical protein